MGKIISSKGLYESQIFNQLFLDPAAGAGSVTLPSPRESSPFPRIPNWVRAASPPLLGFPCAISMMKPFNFLDSTKLYTHGLLGQLKELASEIYKGSPQELKP
ncbi:hypothetical protein DSO57_1005819 [Entomophthora muscae]|uniref:Uncharacterized protein n=1 Tax=Entomophthora muscae TaxID=34485 RepID=A0ACC2TJD6_9FUNG|nr:hypothetical protein DSO57_1005819 [Entomophthora muscae]